MDSFLPRELAENMLSSLLCGIAALNGEMLFQVIRESCGCCFPVSVRGEVGWGPGQPDLVEGIPGHDRAWSYMILRFLLTQTFL